MPLPANPESLTIAQLCQNLQGATMLEAAGLMDWIREHLQMPLQVVLQGYGTELGGPSFARGAVVGATGTIEVIGGVDGTNIARSLLVDGTGTAISRTRGVDDGASARDLLTDRTGILAVAPPVSKLWSLSSIPAGATQAAATQASPGANLRNIVLAWGVSIACGATALTPSATSTAGITSGSMVQGIQVACPINDCRLFAMNGPLILPANQALTVGFSAAGPAGSFETAWAVGYVASFP